MWINSLILSSGRNSNIGVPDFRTNPNITLEEKRDVAGDSNLETAYLIWAKLTN